MVNMFGKDILVFSRPAADGSSHVGHTTGASYRCSQDGCTGKRVVVRWEDGKITRPCSKGMLVKNNQWYIQ